MTKIIINIFILFFITQFSLLAQTDTTLQQNGSSTDSLSNNDSSYVMKKSPWGAVLRSAVLPGYGQYYNESYWKIPVVWGFLGWFGYNYIKNNDDYHYYRDLYLETGEEIYKQYRVFYNDQRDLFAIYFVLAYILNLVDAYVDAHLFDFSVSEDFFSGMPQFRISLRF